MQIYRQGDVLLVRVGNVPAAPSGEPVKRERGGVVLAHGEVTGHRHRIPSRAAEAFRGGAAGMPEWLHLSAPAEIVHEEHTAIKLPAGLYDLPMQVEYTPAELRRVAD